MKESDKTSVRNTQTIEKSDKLVKKVTKHCEKLQTSVKNTKTSEEK